MSACSQCGTVAKPTDKFCNVCGTPIAAAPPAAAPPGYGQQPGFGAPPPGQGGFGPPAPAFGAPPPGQAFGAPPPAGAPQSPRCQMGHEIAPGASYCSQGHPIALDQMQFAAGAPQFGAPPPPQQAFGAPPQQASPYGAPPPPQQAFGAPPAQAYAPQGPSFGAPPQQQQQQYGAPAPQAQAYAPPAQPGYAPAPGFNPQQPVQGDTARDAAPGKILRGFIVAYGTNPSGDFWPLWGGRMAVGRLTAADGIDISMQDPTISSRHAALNIDPGSGAIAVEDTGSTNGTFVNDEHIGFNGRRELRDGDRIRFGGFTAVIKVIGRV